jgi:GNAT superfamily N-acetyltransferase
VPAPLQVVPVGAADAGRLRALRLAALAGDPDGFGSTLERDLARPQAFWDAWARGSAKGEEQRTFALVDPERPDVWLGLAMARIWPERPDEAELLSMYVAPPARGRGGAELLCDACAAWAEERGVAALTLAVYAANGRARRAYAKCGFSLDDDDTAAGDPELLRMTRPVTPARRAAPRPGRRTCS